MRKRGFSIIEIEKKLKINRSTLSGWLKVVQLSKKAKLRLQKHRNRGLLVARQKAVKWHNAQKQIRLDTAESEASEAVRNINFEDSNTLELALAMLYWGEGFKNDGNPGMGNSDPLVLRFFIYVLKHVYSLIPDSFTAQLHLRADQSEKKEIIYWSKQLGLPRKNFKWTQFDKRTIGKKTYSGYHGVCTIYCYDVAIQRKLANISRQFVEELLRA